MKGLIVTGTGTGVGKTVVSAVLLQALALRLPGRPRRYWKLVQTGAERDDDTATVARLAALDARERVAPVLRLGPPLSPYEAAGIAGKAVPAALLRPRLPRGDGVLIVEGAGGLLVPLNATRTLADAFRSLGLPLVVAASPAVGTINHTLLTLEAARRRHLDVAAVVFSGRPSAAVASVIRRMGRPARLLAVPRMRRLDCRSVERAARGLCFDRAFAELLEVVDPA